jgi:alpha-tubulin suppressor-like RCC1 family protein
MALRADGAVAIWGDSAWGVNTLPSGLLAVAGIAAGDGHALAMGSEAPPTVWLPAVRRTLVAESGHAFLHASAIGARPLSYQWRRDGVPIAGATNPVLEVQGLLPGQEGSYSVRVGNAFGSTDSSAARPIAVPLRIVEPPGPFNALVRGTARFSIRVEGAEPLSYQWLREGVFLPGQTNQMLTLSNLAFSAAGNYSVRIANRYGSAQSDDAALRVQTIVGYGQQSELLDGLPSDGTGVVALATGLSRGVALRRDGTVATWGGDSSGPLDAPAGLTSVVAVAAGDHHTLALRRDGTISAWGQNLHGQLNIPAELTNVVMVAAGGSHSLALRADGTVAAWGKNDNGQATVPLGLGDVVAVSAGQDHSVALSADGKVVVWGDNSRGQTNVPIDLADAVMVDAGGYHTLAVRANGTVVAWGFDNAAQLQVPPDLKDAVTLAAGSVHSVALRSDGSVVAWGNNYYGQTAIPAGLGGVVAMAAGDDHTLLLAGMGAPFVSLPPVRRTVLAEVGRCYLAATAVGMLPLRYQWNRNGVPIPNATNAVLTLMRMQSGQEAGYSVTVSNALGVVTSGASVVTVEPLRLDVLPQPTVVIVGGSVSLSVGAVGAGPFTCQWRRDGQDLPGEVDATLTMTNVSFTASGGYSVRVANRYGAVESEAVRVQVQAVIAWGQNDAGQVLVPWELTNAVAVTAGASHTVALLPDGSLLAWGYNGFGQLQVPYGWTDIVEVSAGGWHNVALRSDGTVGVWGANNLGQWNVPASLTNAVAVAAGGWHSLALRADGSVAAWGANDAGQTSVPPGLDAVVAVAAGLSHSLALRADGTVVAWGGNQTGQTNVPAELTDAVTIAAGGGHSLALRANGKVVGWGASDYGQTLVPDASVPYVAVAAGSSHSLALRADGVVVGVGYNAYGQAQPPSNLTPLMAAACGGNHSVVLAGMRLPSVAIPVPKRDFIAGSGKTIFKAVAAGSGPLRYEWAHEGVVLPGATNAHLILSELVVANAGGYTVTVRDANGNTATAQAAVTVQPLSFSITPQSLGLNAGRSAVFFVRAEGVGPFSYQWRKDGVDLPGATNDALQLTNLYFPAAGQYSVRVSNRYGTIDSPAAALQMPDVVAWGASDSGQLEVPGDLTNVVAIMGGQGLAWALREDGTLARWGDTFQAQSTVPSGFSNVVAFALGGSHVLALRQDHTVVAWGSNSRDQSTVPSDLRDVVALAAGSQHSLALRADGTVAAWGDNYYRQTDVPLGLANVVAIAAGDYHSLALRADGVVMAWGRNSLGQGSVPTEVVDVVAIAAGGAHNLALLADGSVMAWGDNANGQTRVPWDVGRVVGIAAKSAHSLALRVDGTVVAWGDNSYGQTTVPVSWNGLVDVAAGVNFNLALHGKGAPFVQGILNDRTIVAGSGVAYLRATAIGEPPLYYQWQREGVDIPGETRPALKVAGLMPGDEARYSVRVGNRHGQAASRACWVRVAPMRFRSVPQPATLVRGGSTTLSVAVEGLGPFTYQWRRDGVDLPGRTNDTLTLSNTQEDAMGRYSVRVANSLGTLESPAVWVGFREVFAWGFNWNGEVNVPAGLGNVLQIAGGDFHSLAVKRDGTVAAWGMTEGGRTAVPADLKDVVAVAGGREGFNLALRHDGTLAGWGQWGWPGATTPARVPDGLGEIVAVCGGVYGALALRADGNAVYWGQGTDSVPTPLSGLSNLVAIAPSDALWPKRIDRFVALRADGHVWLWDGAVWTPLDGLTNIVAISSYGGAVVGLREDGTVASWGGYYGIRIPPPAGLSNVIAVAAGMSHAQALRRDGTVVGWGSNLSGQTNTPAGLSNVVAVAAGWDHTLAQVGFGPPVIRPARPQELVISDPAPVYLYSQAVGAPPLLCQWQADGVDVPGATNGWLRVDQLEELHSTRYQVVVRNAWGAATNLIASLTRQTSPPLLSEMAFEGGRFRCTVSRTSAKLPCVIWQSADLETWTPAYTNAPTAAGFEFATPPVQGTPARFYRATITP